MEAEKTSLTSTLAKYFLHGILFSVLLVVLTLAWALILVALVVVGLFIGLIIGIVLLFFILGWLNAFLTYLVWKIEIRSGWKDSLYHGFVLFIALIAVNIPAALINLIIPDLIVSTLVFIVYCFIDGYAARNVAELWKQVYEEPYEESSEMV